LVKAYSTPHSLELNSFIGGYMKLLNDILDEIWQNIGWKSECKRLIPVIRKDKAFGKQLREKHIAKWPYTKHYVDSAIKQAYSTLNSWRKRYLKGKAGGGRNPPIKGSSWG